MRAAVDLAGESQRAQTLVQADGVQVHDHENLGGRAGEDWLEQERQLAVSVWYVVVSLLHGGDDVCQGTQGLVDCLRFFQSLALHLREVESL